MGGNAQPGAPSVTNVPQGGGLRPGQSAFPGGAGFGGYPPPVDQYMNPRISGGGLAGGNADMGTVFGPATNTPQVGGAPAVPQMPQGAPNYAALAGGRMPGAGGPPPQFGGGMGAGGMPNYAQALQGMFGRR